MDLERGVSPVSHLVDVPQLANAGSVGTTVKQENNFQYLDPTIAVQMAKRDLAQILEGA